jgi:phosphate transport system substrate-binding protein
MKGILQLIAILIVANCLTPLTESVAQSNSKKRLSLSGAFALYPLAVKWAEEYQKVNPSVKIDISAGGAGKGMTDVLNNMVEIGMVSREIYKEEIKSGALGFAVAKDAVVPVISAKNPVVAEIIASGLKASEATDIWITGKNKTWAQAFTTKNKASIHVYTRSDACGAAEIWAKYIGAKQEDLLGSGVFGDPGLALAVKKDALGIGFNNIGYAYDSKTRRQISGIRVVPLDLNNNGKTDPDEDFYTTMDDLIKAITEGKYPSPPARELYFVTKGKPQSKIAADFLRWVLTKGQRFVFEAGYINLSKEKMEAELKKL